MENQSNNTEQTDILEETILKGVKKRVERHTDGAIVTFSSLKYIERIEILFESSIRCVPFINLCDELLVMEDFLAENVRWKRLDTHLEVVQSTFVRFKPVEG